MAVTRHFTQLPFLAAALVCLVSGSAPAETITISPALSKIVEGARQEGALTLQYGEAAMGGARGAPIAAAGIKAMFGVSLDVTYHPGPSFAPMATRLYTEMQANQTASTDVYVGTAVEISPFIERGLFRPIPWTDLDPGRITPEIAEAGGRVLRIVTGIPGVLYNKHVGADFANITVMDDLLKPEYKGRLDTEPYLSGFDVLVSSSVWGYDKTAAFVRKLSGQVAGLVRCGATDLVASGQIPAIAIDCGGAVENLPEYRDVIGHVIVHDAAMRRFNYVAIPTNAAHPNAGILLALYVSSPEGQRNIERDLYGTDLDTYPETQAHAEVAALEKQGVKFIDVTVDWWASQKNIDDDLKKLIKIVTQQ
jgi:ABC-type Fe3+ transport system substrate-binding protein